MRRHYRKRKNNLNGLYSTLVFWLILIVIWANSRFELKIPYYIQILVAMAIPALLFFVCRTIKNALRRRKYLNSSLSQIDKMSGIQFEQFLKAHFETMGYRVKTTPTSNDYGVDLILEKDTEKIAVQAKRYKNYVSNSAVQEIVAGMNYYECNKAMVVTNSYFSKNAIKLAEKNNVTLWDRKYLLDNFKINKT